MKLMKKHPLALAVTFASLALVGCGGGGSGSSSPNPDQGLYEPQTPTPAPEPELTLETVRVGVVDTGFNVANIQQSEKVIGTTNIFTGGSDTSEGDTWHGDVVTSTITSNRLGNARVDLYKVAQNGVTQSNSLNFGLALAAENGARVLNASYANRYRASDPGLSFNGETAQASYDKITNANGGKGAVYVTGAGNDGVAMDVDGRAMYDEQPTLWNMMLIAVGSENDGLSKHPDSNFPGDDTELQNRTLATDYSNPDVGAVGTSIATAQISAYAAGVIGMWPHITATEASQLLLDTASKESPLYDQNNCGATGTMNCGYFYLGQGEADIDAALAPRGEVTVTVADRVDGEQYAADETFAQLSSAYGNSLAESGALDNVAVFDELGRDYRMDLSSRVQQRTSYDRDLQNRMAHMSITSGENRLRENIDMGNFQLQSQFNGYGEIVASRFDSQLGNTTLTAFNFGGGETNPLGVYAESGMMPMLSFQGGSDLTQTFDDVSGLKTSYGITEKLSMTAAHWVGNTTDSQSYANDYKANRSDVGMSYAASEMLTLSSTLGVLNESEGLLGSNSAGALSFGNNNMTFAGLTVDAQLGNNFNAFAQFEQGFGDASGAGLISSINNVKTQEVALGLQWSGKEKAAAFTIRQPMRLESGLAQLNVPVGRTVGGDVLTESREANLSPSGRQVDFEVGYGFKPSTNSQMQFNVMHSLDPGHDAGAPSDTAAMINYSLAW